MQWRPEGRVRYASCDPHPVGLFFQLGAAPATTLPGCSAAHGGSRSSRSLDQSCTAKKKIHVESFHISLGPGRYLKSVDLRSSKGVEWSRISMPRNVHPLLKQFGMQVRKRRVGLGLSQEDLAHSCGLDRTYIGGIERGERNVSLINIFKISVALSVDPGDLLAGYNFEQAD